MVEIKENWPNNKVFVWDAMPSMITPLNPDSALDFVANRNYTKLL